MSTVEVEKVKPGIGLNNPKVGHKRLHIGPAR
jgi:hypothetical protein